MEGTCSLCSKPKKSGEDFRDVKNVHVHWARLMELGCPRKFLSEWNTRKDYYTFAPNIKLEKHFKCFSHEAIANAFAHCKVGKRCHKHCLHAFNFTVKTRFPEFAALTGFAGDRPDFVKFSKSDMQVDAVASLTPEQLAHADAVAAPIANGTAAPAVAARAPKGGRGRGARARGRGGAASRAGKAPAPRAAVPMPAPPPLPAGHSIDPSIARFASTFFDGAEAGAHMENPFGSDDLFSDAEFASLLSGAPPTFAHIPMQFHPGQPVPGAVLGPGHVAALHSGYGGATLHPPGTTKTEISGRQLYAPAGVSFGSAVPASLMSSMLPRTATGLHTVASAIKPSASAPSAAPSATLSRAERPPAAKRRNHYDTEADLNIGALSMAKPVDMAQPHVRVSVCGISKTFQGFGPFIIGRSTDRPSLTIEYSDFYAIQDPGALRYMSRKCFFKIVLCSRGVGGPVQYELQLHQERSRPPTQTTTWQSIDGRQAAVAPGTSIRLSDGDAVLMGPMNIMVSGIYIPRELPAAMHAHVLAPPPAPVHAPPPGLAMAAAASAHLPPTSPVASMSAFTGEVDDLFTTDFFSQ